MSMMIAISSIIIAVISSRYFHDLAVISMIIAIISTIADIILTTIEPLFSHKVKPFGCTTIYVADSVFPGLHRIMQLTSV
jgi:hypothetical protein